jgi:BASS family bile acid:Na+ symporter
MTWLTLLAKLSVLTFVVSSMLAMGAGLTVAQILEPLSNLRQVLGALLANFVLAPLVAILLARTLRLEEGLAMGLLVVGCTAGAPFLPKLAELAGGSLAFAVGLMVLLMVVTIGYLPIVLPRLVPNATVEPWRIAKSLLLLMLLPLVLGLILKARYPLVAARVKPFLDAVASVSVILLIVLLIVLSVHKVAVFGTFGILAAFVFAVLAFGIGWILGGPSKDTRRVMALGTAQRNIGAALVVGGALRNLVVADMVIVVAIVGLIVLIPLSRALGKR